MEFLEYQQHEHIDTPLRTITNNYVQYSKPVKNYPLMRMIDLMSVRHPKSDEIARAKQLSSKHQTEKKNHRTIDRVTYLTYLQQHFFSSMVGSQYLSKCLEELAACPSH